MNTSLHCDAYGVADLPADVAATIEGGAFGLGGIVEALGTYLLNNVGALVDGVKDGWNGYEP